LRPSGNWISATGARESPGTRMLTSTISCPVLLSTAVCSTAHSSGASRLGLPQRAIQPGGGGVFGCAASACGAARAGGDFCADCDFGVTGGVVALGCCAWAVPVAAAAIAIAARNFFN